MSERSTTTVNRVISRSERKEEEPSVALLTSEIISTDPIACSEANAIAMGSVSIGALSTIAVCLATHKPLRSYYIQSNDLFAAIDSCLSSSTQSDDKWTHKLIIHNGRDSVRNLRIIWSE